MIRPLTLLCGLMVSYGAVAQEIAPVVLSSGTPFAVSIAKNLGMKKGEAVHAELLYPIYDHDRLVLPAKTAVTGEVVELTPDRTRRIHARLRGDFTPFHLPVVRFSSVTMADGTVVPLVTGTATNGAPVYRLVAPSPRKGGLIAQQLGVVKDAAKDRIKVVTGPDKGDRLLQFVYSQLPYHPERIVKGTAWTVETAADVTVPVRAAAVPAPQSVSDTTPRTFVVQAYLDDAMSSETSKAGQAIRAVVAEPVLNPDGTVAVPQGAVLTGAVTAARPARSFGRVGELRFSFREMTLPGAAPVAVQAQVTGADGAQDMAMNAEGEVKPKPQDKLAVPLILIAAAFRPLDQDHGNRHQLAKDGVASNSIGVLGFILGTAAQKPNLAAGLGFYGAGISVYERYLRKGKEVAFKKDTRVVIQTTGRRTAAIKPNAP